MTKQVIFFSISIIYFLVAFYNHEFILTDNFINSALGYNLTSNNIKDSIDFVRKWQWISYLFIPLVLLLRITFTWICLKAGSFITDRFTETSFWKIAIQAEIVFAVGAVAGLLYTEFFVNVESLEQLSLNPFSLQVFVSDSVPKWSSYFFNTLNIFELGYVFVLAHLIAEETKNKVLPSLKFVASTYLPGLALWVLLVSYLTVVFQP
jgi:hypothetical protein